MTGRRRSDSTAQVVGRVVRERRAELGLTQQAAASLAEVSPTTWRDVETARAGRYRPITLAAISRALGWPSDLLGRLSRGEAVPELDREPVPVSPEQAIKAADWMTEEEKQGFLSLLEGLRRRSRRDKELG